MKDQSSHFLHLYEPSSGAAISGACYKLAKGNNKKLTEEIDFFQWVLFKVTRGLKPLQYGAKSPKRKYHIFWVLLSAKNTRSGSSAIQTSNKTCIAHMDIGSSGSQYLIKVTFAAILNEVWPQFNNANIWVVRRKEGGQYGFTAAIAADEQKLVVGNPMQRSYVYKRGAHACGSVGEVNPNNVFKAPGCFCFLNRLNRIWQRRLFFSCL